MKKLILIGIIFLIMMLGANAIELDNASVYYSMDSGQYNATYIFDSSGNEYDVLFFGDTAFAGIINESLNFDGTSDYVDTGQNFDIGTVSFWFKSPNIGTAIGMMSQRFDSTEAQNNWDLQMLSDGTIELNFYSPSFNFIDSSSSGFDDDNWHHVVILSGSGGLEMYIDGNLNGSNAYTGVLGSSPNAEDFDFGRAGENGAYNYHDGVIDELVIYPEKINSTQIEELYNSGLGFNPYISESDIETSDEINLSNFQPANNNQFSTTSVSFSVIGNFTYSTTCDLYINGVSKATQSGISGTNQLVNKTATLTDLSSSDVYYSCYNTNTTQNTTTNTIYVDTQPPTYDFNLEGNNTYWSGFINYSLNVTEQNWGVVNLTDTCGNSYSNTTASLTLNYEESFSLKSCSVGTKTTNLVLCDAPNGTYLNCIYPSFSWENTAYLNITATSILNGTLISDFRIEGDLTGNTTTGFLQFYNLTNGTTYQIDFISDSFEQLQANVTISGTYTLVTFEPYTLNSINFSFYDADTLNLINQNILVEFISDSFTYNYTATDGKLYVDLLSPETYTIRYSSTGYDLGQYEYVLTNRSHGTLDLYMINETGNDEITMIVYNEATLTTISGAYIYLQKYYQEEGVFKTIAVYETDISGKAYFYVEKFNEYYKVLVEYPFGESRLATEKFYINADNINLYISLEDDPTEAFFKAQDIDGTITFDNTTREFSATYNDPSSQGSQYCLYVKEFGYYGNLIVNQQCSTSPSGTIPVEVGTENKTYFALFTATIDGKETPIATGWINLENDELNAGSMGILMTIGLIMVFVLMGATHIMALVLAGVGLLLVKLIGLISLGWGTITAVIICSLVLTLILKLKK